MKKLIIIIGILASFISCFSNNIPEYFFLNYKIGDSISAKTIETENSIYIKSGKDIIKLNFEPGKKRRGIAISLTIFTGIMGMHRVYLGTSPVVPAVYSITLGGGLGALTITDLCFLIFSKEISQFENNPKVFMWIRQ